MREPLFTMRLSLIDPYGRALYHRAEPLPLEVCSDLTQSVGDMRLAHDVGLSIGMDAVVTLMRRRQFRRDAFVRHATQMGDQMADFMEDKEGWHGPDRAESAHDRAKDFDR
jgi:hypothetical protein